MRLDCITRETTISIKTFKMTTQMRNWTETPTIYPDWIKEFKGDVEFAALEVKWFIFCCMGLWAGSQGVRVLCLVEGIV